MRQHLLKTTTKPKHTNKREAQFERSNLVKSSFNTHVEVVDQGAGLDDDLVEDRVVVVAKQDVVAHRGVLDPRFLRRQAEAGLPLGDEDGAVQPAGNNRRRSVGGNWCLPSAEGTESLARNVIHSVIEFLVDIFGLF